MLKLNENGDGGEYFQSKSISLVLDAEGVPLSRDSSSLIAAIIAYWVCLCSNVDMPLQIAEYFVSRTSDPA